MKPRKWEIIQCTKCGVIMETDLQPTRCINCHADLHILKPQQEKTNDNRKPRIHRHK